MSPYVFEGNATDREWHRLRLIERAVDPETVALLEQTGLSEGSSCLEIGAGAGSIVEWMAARVGRAGLVFAVDKRTAYLPQGQNPQVLVLEGNFMEIPLDRPVDVAHARYLLIHNANHRELLAKIRGSMKPGGLVVLEEPDFTSAVTVQPDRDASIDRVNLAMCQMFRDAGLDPAYGLGLPARLTDAGFEVVRLESRLHLCPGAAPIAELMAESALVLRQSYVNTGLATDRDIDHYVDRARDPRWWAVYYTTVSALARAV